MEIRSNEQILTEYMQKHYSDERLAALLAHAEDGRLSYMSCCCFIGIPSADHALRGAQWHLTGQEHLYAAAYGTDDGRNADTAYLSLAFTDADRRAKLIPLIHVEIKRRDDLKIRVSTSNKESNRGT